MYEFAFWCGKGEDMSSVVLSLKYNVNWFRSQHFIVKPLLPKVVMQHCLKICLVVLAYNLNFNWFRKINY